MGERMRAWLMRGGEGDGRCSILSQKYARYESLYEQCMKRAAARKHSQICSSWISLGKRKKRRGEGRGEREREESTQLFSARILPRRLARGSRRVAENASSKGNNRARPRVKKRGPPRRLDWRVYYNANARNENAKIGSREADFAAAAAAAGTLDRGSERKRCLARALGSA